jgi:hypothetical protein
MKKIQLTDLPFEILENVLKRLSPEDLVVFKACSRECTTLVRKSNLPIPDQLDVEEFARRGERVLWAHEQGCPLVCELFDIVSRVGDEAALQVTFDLGCSWNEWTCSEAVRRAEDEAIATLTWLREHGCPWNARCLEIACLLDSSNENRKGDVVRWLIENKCPMNEMACAMAARAPSLRLLKYLREHGCPWDHLTCSRAALHGRFETLKWARENGCPWDSKTFTNAFFNGHRRILEYALNHGCPTNPHELQVVFLLSDDN